MTVQPHVIYCHGFASGPETTSKGRYLREKLGPYCASFSIPDLEGGDFFHLTIDSMRQRLAAAMPKDGAPVVLAGSSLGGWLAASEATHLQVSGLLLISPAFGFADRWQERFGEAALDAWRTTGSQQFFHFRSQSQQALGADFLRSCETINQWPAPPAIPTILIHGRNDEQVLWSSVMPFVSASGAEFHLLNEGHSVDSAAAMALLGDCALRLLQQVSAECVGKSPAPPSAPRAL